MRSNLKHFLLCLLVPAVMACNNGSEDDKTIASTHPQLEEQLEKDSVTTPVDAANSEDLYQRYRITLEEYENDNAYVVQSIYKGSMPNMDAGSNKEIASHKTALQEGLQEGVNFAGKYTVVTVDCGKPCKQHYIVNRETGKITETIKSSIGAKYSSNSRIFITNPPDSTVDYRECINCMPEAYVMENGKLRKLSYEEGSNN